jgi:regulatory protein
MALNKTFTEQQVMQRLTALCARGEHCQHDMTEKMRQWHVDEATQARVMEYLVKERYVDDRRYARAFVHEKVHFNQWGRRKVEQALWQKHIDHDVAREALDSIDNGEYVGMLQGMLRQKRKSVKAGSDYELNMKLMKWAAGRGFTMDIIRKCLDVSDEDEFLD